jgi:hypothetical protein
MATLAAASSNPLIIDKFTLPIEVAQAGDHRLNRD